MWAILTEDPEKLGNHWDPTAFFQSGANEVNALLARARALHPNMDFDRALDFGCGVGRLSRALSPHFRSVLGVDIAPSMIKRARELNAAYANCEFLQNDSERLANVPDGSVSFVYSNIVLQHMPKQYAFGYIKEFFRVTRPGGLVVFQLPSSNALSPKRLIVSAFLAVAKLLPRPQAIAYRQRKYKGATRELIERLPASVMEMHGSAKSKVVQQVQAAGGDILATDFTRNAIWSSYMYYAKRL